MTAPERERVAVVGFYVVAVFLVYLVYLMFSPFLVPLAWAAVLAICFYPAHRKLERRFRHSIAALLSTVSIGLVVIVPMLAAGSAFVSEGRRILEDVPKLIMQMPASANRWLETGLEYVPGGAAIDPAALIAEWAQRLAAFLSGRAAGVLQDLTVFIFDLVLMIFALFFLFRVPPSLMAAIRRITPLDEHIRERLFHQIQRLVTAGVTSAIIVAVVQGAVCGLTFWLLGLSGPVFWGVVTAVFCLLPFGAWVVWGPAAIWLIFSGNVVRGLVLAGMGAGVVSAVDNVLRPLLLSERSEMNGLLLFVSLLGGVVAFGTVGIVVGPVLMATAVGLFQTFTSPVESTTEDARRTKVWRAA